MYEIVFLNKDKHRPFIEALFYRRNRSREFCDVAWEFYNFYAKWALFSLISTHDPKVY